MQAADSGSKGEAPTHLFLVRRVDCVDGVAAYLESVITALRRIGDRVVLASGPVTTPDGSETRRKAIADAALDWLVIEDLRTMPPRLGQIRRILRFMRRHGVDLVSPQGFGVLPYAKMLGLAAGLPVVLNYHPSTVMGANAAAVTKTGGKRRAALHLINRTLRADAYLASSSEIAAFYREDCGVPARRVHKTPFGFDEGIYRPPSAEERSAARARFGLLADDFVCVLPGRLNHMKGHDIAVAAARMVREDSGRRVVCLFPGSGDQRAEIVARTIVDPGDEELFRFLGFVPDAAAMREVFWASDVMVLPSRHEGFALVVPEAMASGLVPIRTPSGGAADQIVEGESGFIVPFDDAPALADRMMRLMNAETRERMTTLAAERALTRFTSLAMGQSTSAAFRHVTGAGRD